MNKENLLPSSTAVEPIHWGHLKLVLAVALVLLGFSWLKNPQLFSVFQKPKTATKTAAGIPRYYAYVAPAEDSQPMVAGASTLDGNVPSVINEDGSITPVVDVGEVLGVSTEELNLSLDAIKVKTVADSEEARQNYFSAADAVENNYLNNLEFETAITSSNQTAIDAQLDKVKGIVDALQKISVPGSLVELHKNKILQYSAAITILQNYTKAEENPELVSQALGVFLQAQQQIENLTLTAQSSLEQ